MLDPFEIRFVANQPAFQKVLNDFAASSKQFFITRTLIIENLKLKALDGKALREYEATLTANTLTPGPFSGLRPEKQQEENEGAGPAPSCSPQPM